jgi:HEAT repeat protein
MSSISPAPDPPHGPRDQSAKEVSAEQLLPPVEPPSAQFLLQLFVVPAVIVGCVVLLWLGIETLARSGEQDPAAIVRGLRSSNQTRFQQAKDLADMLRTPERYAALQSSRELAQGVAGYLDELIDAGDKTDAEVTMRYILVSVLGEMQVDDGLPALIKAARLDPERDVRRKALGAIAVLADSLGRLEPPQYLASDELVAALAELARDKDELIRSEAAFAIGVVASAPDADSRLDEALRELADDPYTDARFNAAAALARIGSPLAPAAVAEMFDLEALASSIRGEKPLTEDQTGQELRSQQAYKRNTILNSGLSAIEIMLRNNPPAETLAPLEQALAQFVAAAPAAQDPSPIPRELVKAAQRMLARIEAARRQAG